MTALLFPGQGTQRIGMGLVFDRGFAAEAGEVAELAAQIDPELSVLIRRGPESELAVTSNAQLAVTMASLKALAIVDAADVRHSVVAGHSVGLLPALVAARVMDARLALGVARVRGRIMGALPKGGAMASVIGLTPEVLHVIAKDASRVAGLSVVVGLVNGPLNGVLSGHVEAVAVACDSSAARGGRTRRLAVSHAFHSPLMAPAVNQWNDFLETIQMHEPSVPIVSDMTGVPLTTASELRDLLRAQFTQTVRWDLVCERIVAMNQVTAIETGDSRILRQFGRAYPSLQVLSMADVSTLAMLRSRKELPANRLGQKSQTSELYVGQGL